MIGIIFMYASEMVEVRVNGKDITFRSGAQPMWATIEGIRLDKVGVIKEFPDLETQSNWRAQAIERFKDKIAILKTEKQRAEYISQDLQKHGYIPKYIQKGGHRVQRIK